MALIEWSSNLSVGVSEMDDQHKKLIKMINDLHEAMKTGKGKEITAKIVADLINYTHTHFSAEEKYMAQFKYPDIDKQKAAHAAFVKKISDIQKSVNAGQLVTMDVMKFLNSWLTEHIIGMDKKYTSFFNGGGLK
ncbi:MAG TPA: bacteriohemerythrin [Candidatus Wallbacteria bacterium]|nr:MAG: Bacteriohemerythrin [bacterium ADurb.Bin243]HOD39814.1 bacteriohemerythrin [Candidatus Wallbacteria bacterium]HPG58972.1 bacteriohemerythrin [Candidatus Wallbacteria bacterium]